MPDEIDFCRQCFQIVRNQLEDESLLLEREDRLRYEREYRLLGYILYERNDGQVLRALEQWRGRFGRELAEHMASIRPLQHAYDNWLGLSAEERASVPEPPGPSPGIVIVDRNGHKWVIDQRYLRMMDDLINRLKKWLAAE